MSVQVGFKNDPSQQQQQVTHRVITQRKDNTKAILKIISIEAEEKKQSITKIIEKRGLENIIPILKL